MKIIGLSDIHGDISALPEISEEAATADLVLIAGDLTHFGDRVEAQSIIAGIMEINRKILAVSGNCDNTGVEQYLAELGLSLHGKRVKIEGAEATIAGFGGSVTTPAKTPNTRPETEFDKFFTSLGEKTDILLLHQPPYNTAADIVMNIRHTGSAAVRNYIDKYQPMLCLCGHIHESRGKGFCGRTLVVNPGPFKNGFYTIITGNCAEGFSAELKKAKQ